MPRPEGELMLTILFLLIWRTVATVHGYIKAYAPSNLAIAYLRTRRGLKWAIPTAVVIVPSLLYVAYLTTLLVDHGATRWLLVLSLVCLVDVCKFGTLALLAPILGLKNLQSRDALLDV